MAMTATMDARQVIDRASRGRKCFAFALRGAPRRQGATVEYPGSKQDRNGIESRSMEAGRSVRASVRVGQRKLKS
jgi:hypothetical protein